VPVGPAPRAGRALPVARRGGQSSRRALRHARRCRCGIHRTGAPLPARRLSARV